MRDKQWETRRKIRYALLIPPTIIVMIIIGICIAIKRHAELHVDLSLDAIDAFSDIRHECDKLYDWIEYLKDKWL